MYYFYLLGINLRRDNLSRDNLSRDNLSRDNLSREIGRSCPPPPGDLRARRAAAGAPNPPAIQKYSIV